MNRQFCLALYGKIERSGPLGIDPTMASEGERGGRRGNLDQKDKSQTKSFSSSQDIDEEQQLLEEKGVALETKLRSEEEDEDESVMESAWAEWFQLVNRKNELFRREMELYHTRRMQVGGFTS